MQIAIAVAQAEGRHQAARLDLLRVGNPAAQVLGRVRDHARGQRLAAHQVRQVRGIRALRPACRAPDGS